MKLKNIYNITFWTVLTAITGSAISCNKFLDAKPSKNNGVIISTTGDLDAVLNNYRTFSDEQDNVVIWGTDDNGLDTTLAAAQPYDFSSAAVQFSCWDLTYLAQTDQTSFLGPNFWSGEYAKIYNANTILANVNTVTGSASDKAAITADAHFIRAYSYWELANTYCLPYTDANKNEPGLPIKTTPDYTLVARSSLADTYAQIAADLAEALKTTVPLVQGGVNKFQRANTAGVNAFAARYYLNLNDYANALKYANASLAEYSTLVDYNTDMHYGLPTTITINNSTNPQTVTVNFPYTHDRSLTDPVDIFGWKEFLYYRMLLNTDQWFIPSQELLDLYDKQHDLRYKYNIVQNYSYTKYFTDPALSYPGYVFFSNNGAPEGPTTAEMYLIKAECLARTGDINGAMTAVNQLYSKRTINGTPPLTATSQDQAITVIIQERRREMPFSERWFDIRRVNNNSDANDDVPLLSRTFYTYGQYGINTTQAPVLYTLPKGSRRFASPLPQSDVTSSNGLIKQNTY